VLADRTGVEEPHVHNQVQAGYSRHAEDMEHCGHRGSDRGNHLHIRQQEEEEDRLGVRMTVVVVLEVGGVPQGVSRLVPAGWRECLHKT